VANFPTLKTGAVAQYPADRTRNFSTTVYRFVDGTEQRYPQYGTALKKWAIRLALLEELELTALGDFFVSVAGRAGEFSFTDPWDGTVYPRCCFDSDVFDAQFLGEAKGSAVVIVREKR